MLSRFGTDPANMHSMWTPQCRIQRQNCFAPFQFPHSWLFPLFIPASISARDGIDHYRCPKHDKNKTMFTLPPLIPKNIKAVAPSSFYCHRNQYPLLLNKSSAFVTHVSDSGPTLTSLLKPEHHRIISAPTETNQSPQLARVWPDSLSPRPDLTVTSLLEPEHLKSISAPTKTNLKVLIQPQRVRHAEVWSSFEMLAACG